tara:strand:- start:557 stop:961 length:405 start_codon:yes stop_codon:yes gene_type:complete
MIQFIINKDELTQHIDCDINDSILSLKNKIIDDFNLSCKYIDIDFQLERPIRSLGKFNLEPGIIPRTLDNYTFDRYDLNDREINATFIEVNDYNPEEFNQRKKQINFTKYKKEKENTDDTSFNIHSEDDFPSLG